jgi:hypothetical protein
MLKQFIDDNNNPISVFAESDTQVVDGTSASAQSTAITTGRNENLVRIATLDKNVNIDFGTNPTATASTMILPLGTVEFFKVYDGYKIAVLGGKISITLMQ